MLLFGKYIEYIDMVGWNSLALCLCKRIINVHILGIYRSIDFLVEELHVSVDDYWWWVVVEEREAAGGLQLLEFGAINYQDFNFFEFLIL